MVSPLRVLDRVQRFYKRPLPQKLLVLEAYILLLLARLAVRALPFNYIARWSGTQGLEMSSHDVPIKRLLALRWALITASRYGLWNCQCLTQALAAKAMLRRRGIESTLYLGLKRPEESKLSAHAWLRCGKMLLTGEKGHQQFAVVAMFT